MIHPEREYPVLITYSTCTYPAPVNLGVYAVASLAAGGIATQCKQIVNNGSSSLTQRGHMWHRSTWVCTQPQHLQQEVMSHSAQCTQIINNHKVKQLSYTVYSELKKPAMISPFMASEMMHLRPSISSVSTLSTHQPLNAKDTYTTRRSR